MKSDIEKRIERLEKLLPYLAICDSINTKLNDLELRMSRLEYACHPMLAYDEIRRRTADVEVEFSKYRMPRDHYAHNAVVDDGK